MNAIAVGGYHVLKLSESHEVEACPIEALRCYLQPVGPPNTGCEHRQVHKLYCGTKVLCCDRNVKIVAFREPTHRVECHGNPVNQASLYGNRSVAVSGDVPLDSMNPWDIGLIPRVDRLERIAECVTSDCLGGSTEVELTEDLGYLIGAIIGAGTVRDDVIRIVSKSTPVLRKCYRTLVQLFRRNVPLGCVEGSELAFYSPFVASRMVQWVVARLPPFALEAPRPLRKGLFAGLMDVSSSILSSENQVSCRYFSTNFDMIIGVKWLAASLGIRSTFDQQSNTSPGTCDEAASGPSGKVHRREWRLVFAVPDVRRWNGDGMQNQNKWGVIFQDETLDRADQKDIVPIPRSLAHVLCKLVGRGSPGVIMQQAKQHGYMTRWSAQRTLALFRDNVMAMTGGPEWVALVASTDIGWDRVELAYAREGWSSYGLVVPGADYVVCMDQCFTGRLVPTMELPKGY